MKKVYFIQDGDAVKVGLSSAPQERLAQLQVGNPRKLLLLAEFEGNKCAENRLHVLLREHLIHGEWFSLGGVLTALALFFVDTSNKYHSAAQDAATTAACTRFDQEIVSFLSDEVRSGGNWEGTSSQLLDFLDTLRPLIPDGGWPSTPSALSSRVRKLEPVLQEVGVHVRFAREAGTGRRLVLLSNEAARQASACEGVANG